MLNFSTESEKVKDSDLLHILGNDQSEKLSPLRQPCFSILTTRNLESKFKFQVFLSRQDRKINLSVRFLGEVTPQKFCFEIYWPLVYLRLSYVMSYYFYIMLYFGRLRLKLQNPTYLAAGIFIFILSSIQGLEWPWRKARLCKDVRSMVLPPPMAQLNVRLKLPTTKAARLWLECWVRDSSMTSLWEHIDA